MVLRLLVLWCCLAALPAQALIIDYSATLSGANENPPIPSLGTGLVTVTIDTGLNTMTVDVSFADLTGNTTIAHLHCCGAPPANSGVATPLPTFPGFPAGVTAGLYNETFDLGLATTFNNGFISGNGGTADGARDALLAGLDAGEVYLNIHTSFAPGGEIRGFLQRTSDVPAPGSLLLFALGLAGLGLARRRATA